MATARPYHHGNLRAALVDAGVELARAGGPDAVVLREACRRVGVSHNAAYRHFPDRGALLTAVGERAMGELAELMEHLVAQSGVAQQPVRDGAGLEATGRAYITFALTEPGLFRTAFSAAGGEEPLAPHEWAESPELGPFGLLGRELDRLCDAGLISAQRRAGAEVTAWSAVHGLSLLLLDGPLRALPDAEREGVIDRLLSDCSRGLLAA